MVRLLLVAVMSLMIGGASLAGQGYSYIAPEKLNESINDGSEMVIVDIRDDDAFKSGHITGARATGAYPVKSDEERARLDELLEKIANTQGDVVIVCPRGKGGATRTFDYYKGKGVDLTRLKILTGGMEGWSFGLVTL